MTITILRDYTLNDVVRELARMLREGTMLPETRQLALEVISQHEDQISAIYDFVKENVLYQPDPYQVELFIHPRRMIEFYYQGIARGDCDDIALITASLLRSLGYQANIVLLDTRGQGIDHAVTEVTLGGVRIMVDSSSSYLPLGWEESSFDKVEVS